MDKIRDLELGEQIIGVSGILLFIDSFLNWFSFDAGFVEASQNAWDNFFSLLAVLIGILMVVVLVIQNFTGVGLPDKLGTLSWAQGYLIAGSVALVLVLIQLLVGSDVAGVDLDRDFGLFLGLVFSAGLAVGGFLMLRGAEEGEAPGGPAAPPPPPTPPQG